MAEVGAQTQRKETATPAGPLRSQREQERCKENSPEGRGNGLRKGGGGGKWGKRSSY